MKLKLKTVRKKRDWKDTWLQTAISVVGLAFAVLAGFGVLTPEQVTEAQPIVNSALGAAATIIAGVFALIGIFAKQKE